jgi:hypothetical protein
MKIKILFLTICSIGFAQNIYAQTNTYTPPPMFESAPVTATTVQPIPAPAQQHTPIQLMPAVQQQAAPPAPQPIKPTIQQAPPELPKQSLDNLSVSPISEDDLYSDGTIKNSIPLPILSTPNSETQRENAIKQQRAREEARKRAIEEERNAKLEFERQERELKKASDASMQAVNAEALLDFPVTNDGGANSPLTASEIAKSKLPQPKEGETIDDTGVPESKIRRPEPLPAPTASSVIKNNESNKKDNNINTKIESQTP